jgi:tetratricopeptide (TPR) repeat protein
MAAFCLALLCGCNKAEEKRPSAVQPAQVKTGTSDDAQAPYYYGLIEEYRTHLAEDPNNLAALIALGNAYFDTGQWKKAITIYQHALHIDAHNADVRTDMGTAYRNLGQLDRALAEYRLALHHDPAHLNARYNMGIVFAYDRKDSRAAIRVWEELLAMAPNFPQADRIRSNMAALKGGAGKDPR